MKLKSCFHRPTCLHCWTVWSKALFLFFFSVENLAFKKDSWINKKTLYKRHIRHNVSEGHASRAVDGNLDLRLESCTVLDNLYGKYPLWTVDLGRKTDVSGVVIYTWQGDEKGKTPRTMKKQQRCKLHPRDAGLSFQRSIQPPLGNIIHPAPAREYHPSSPR